MNILIVEDNNEKGASIARIINNIGNINILQASAINSAINLINDKKDNIDLVLLDMGLPTFIDGRVTEVFGGLDILRYIVYEELSIPVIIITSHTKKDVLEEMNFDKNELDNILLDILEYDITKSYWQDRLVNLIKQ